MKIIFQMFAHVVLVLTFSAVGFAENSISVAGTGDSQTLMRQLGRVFEEKHPGTTVTVPDSVGSGGGIKAVAAGKTDLARTARPLKQHEQEGLIEHRFAASPVVFAVHASVQGVEGLSHDQIIGIYSGTIRNWKEVGGVDHKIFPVDRESGDSSRSIVERHMEGFKGIKSRGKVFYTTGEAAAAIAGNEYTIGFLPLAIALSNKLTVLSVNGVAPSRENILSNKYIMVTPFYVVSKGEAAGLAAEFIKFLASDAAKETMNSSGVVPVL